MKSLKITLTAAFVVLMIVAKAANVGSTYSHLPLNLKEALVEKFNQFEPAANEPMNGNIWIEFHLNENQEIQNEVLSQYIVLYRSPDLMLR